MNVRKYVKSVFRSLFQKEELDKDLDEELQSYLDLVTQEEIDNGRPPPEARRLARLRLGGVEQVKERVRDHRLGVSLDTLSQDIRYSVRALRKNVGFAVVAASILAIGIGANTALFSTINSVLSGSGPFRGAGAAGVGPQDDRGQTLWAGVDTRLL